MNFLNVVSLIVAGYAIYYAGNILWDMYTARQSEIDVNAPLSVFDAEDALLDYVKENNRDEVSEGTDPQKNKTERKGDPDDKETAGVTIVGEYDTDDFLREINALQGDEVEEFLDRQSIFYQLEMYNAA